MINHQHRCIFVHIPKTAGKSVLRFFDMSWQAHTDLAKYTRDLDTDVLQHYTTFTIVRNPWERMVSDYHFQKQKSTSDNKRLHLFNQDGTVRSFREWLNVVMADPFKAEPSQWGGAVSTGMHRWSPQLDWISLDGQINVDHVLRLEHLSKDFPRLCRALNLPPAELPCRNWKLHGHYSSYYDDVTRQMVADYYAKDIGAFGYEFMRPANRTYWFLTKKLAPRLKSAFIQ